MGTQIKSATACYYNAGQVCTCEVFEVDAGGGGQGSFEKWHHGFLGVYCMAMLHSNRKAIGGGKYK